MGRKIKEGEHKTGIFFRLKSESNWELIDELMKLDKYKNNRTELLNDALDYGLPILLRVEMGDVIALDDEAQKIKKKNGNEPMTANQGDLIIDLLAQTNLNANIMKSILCSLFHVKLYELKKREVRAEDLEKGHLQNIPEFMRKYAIQAMSKMKKED